MIYRNALVEDIPAIMELQKKFHIATIDENDKADGFVTTLFTPEQLEVLIVSENGITAAFDGERLVAYVMAASWNYWSQWPIFRHMISELESTKYLGQTLSTENSYQYGPVCIDKEWRGTALLPEIFEYSRLQMSKRYPFLITFVNYRNPRSFAAHTRKLGLDVVRSFEFNGNQYHELGCSTTAELCGRAR